MIVYKENLFQMKFNCSMTDFHPAFEFFSNALISAPFDINNSPISFKFLTAAK